MSAISAITSIGGGLASYYGASKAADAQKSAAKYSSLLNYNTSKKSISAQEKALQEIQNTLKPWRQVGESSLKRLYNQVTGKADTFETSPGYEWRMDQGIEAVNRGASAAGRLDSGARDKDLMRFGQGLASDEYNNYLNRLASMAGMGQVATGQSGNASLATGAGVGDTYQNLGITAGNNALNAGNAQASGYINAANTTSNLLNNLYGAYLMKG